mmetsp:Transcript_116955/g.215068  ORF Transcript_116955/g.215068 Transcript_116955/m.215068 type:complete len:265 (-) Transcript_116955:147-941(-)
MSRCQDLLVWEELVNKAILKGLRCGEVKIPSKVAYQLVLWLPSELGETIEHPVLVPQNLLHLHFHLCGLHWALLRFALVIHGRVQARGPHVEERVGQCEALTLRATSYDEGADLSAYAHVQRLDVEWHQAHSIVHRQARLGHPTSNVAVHVDGPACILILQVKQQSNVVIGSLIIHVPIHKHNALTDDPVVHTDPARIRCVVAIARTTGTSWVFVRDLWRPHLWCQRPHHWQRWRHTMTRRLEGCSCTVSQKNLCKRIRRVDST